LDWWQEAKRSQANAQGPHLGILLVPWMVWKQCNSCVFEGARPSFSHTMASIKAEAVD
jgi:hypothetical protein